MAGGIGLVVLAKKRKIGIEVGKIRVRIFFANFDFGKVDELLALD